MANQSKCVPKNVGPDPGKTPKKPRAKRETMMDSGGHRYKKKGAPYIYKTNPHLSNR